MPDIQDMSETGCGIGASDMCPGIELGGRVMVFNATFNNISVISSRSVLLGGIGVPEENHRPAASH